MTAWRSELAVPCLLFLACCALYAVNLDIPPDFDELYHVLAARGFAETGRYAIADGIYERGWPLTRVIAALFGLLGDDVWIARLPSLLCVASTVTLLYVWLRREAGNRAALIAVLLFAVSPFSLDIAHFARFYAFHGLAFLLGSICIYDLVTHPAAPRVRLIRGVIASAAFAAAIMFQITTLIGLAALGAWLVLQLVGPWLLSRNVPRGRRLAFIILTVVLLGLAIAAAGSTGMLAKLLGMYRSTPLWSADNADNAAYYHAWMILYYPTLWSLLPILLVGALSARPQTGFFLFVMTGVGLVLHSFAGSKSLRYVYYIMPFLFALWGIGLASILSAIVRFAREQTGTLFARLYPAHPKGILGLIVLFLSGAWIVAANAASVRSLLMLANVTIPPELPPTRWDLAKPVLAPLIRAADVVVVTSELDALYFLGDYDVLVSRSRLDERPGSDTPQFSVDPRTGRPIISTAEALAQVMACHRTGIVITSIYRWRHAPMLDNDVADMIVRSAKPVLLPQASRVMAYTWRHEPTADRSACSGPSASSETPAGAREEARKSW